jgi:hypothetical protein
MWKHRPVTLCGCLAILPLIVGCASSAGTPRQAYAPPASYSPPPSSASAPAYAPAEAYAPTQGFNTAPAGYMPSFATVAAPAEDVARVYAVGSGAPAAIIVTLPGPGDAVTANPELWAAQGFDVVAPTPPEIRRLMAAQQATAARLIATAQAIADAPIWVVGSTPAIDTVMSALPAAGSGRVSGVVVTSTRSGAGTCSEQMVYSYSGSGAPKISVSRSGDACPPGAPFGIGSNSTVAPSMPALRQHQPRLIETSAPGLRHPRPRVIEANATAQPGAAAAQATVRRIAGLIKSAPPG